MAGTLDLVQRAYLGTEIRDDVLYFNPTVTDRLDGLRLVMQFRRTPISVSLDGAELTVAALADGYSGADQGRRRRRRPRAPRRRQRHVHDRRSRRRRSERAQPTANAQAGFEGAIFDVDGVLVDSPHEAAWRETLRELMETSWSDIRPETTWAPERFTSHVYQEVVAGKPRMSGARAALEYFGLPDCRRARRGVRRAQAADGRRADRSRPVHRFPRRGATASRGSRRRDPRSRRVLVQEHGPPAEKGSVDTFADQNSLQFDFIRPGQTLLDVLDLDISGRTFSQGKPHPEIFLTAARELGVAAEACFVVEDAVSGITAAKAGGMAALGIARADDEQLLSEAGADLVVTTLDDVDREPLLERRLVRVPRGLGDQVDPDAQRRTRSGG